MKWAGGSALVVLAACGPSEIRATGAIPADAAWVAGLLFDDDGALVAATGLSRFDGTARPMLEEADADELVVLAWTEAALGEYVPAGGAATSGALRLAVENERALPSPGWAGRASPPGRTLTESSFVRALTADWVPACPRVVGPDEEALVDLRCAGTPCPLRFSQVGCEIALPLAGCGLARFVATVQADGSLSFAGERACFDLAVVPEGVSGTSLCDECTIAVHVRSKTPPPAPPTERIALAEPFVEAQGKGWPYKGPLNGMQVLGDRVFALVSRLGCGGRIASAELVVLDAASGRVVSRETTVGCWEGAYMVPDPWGDGVIVARMVSSTTVAVSRHDASGVSVAETRMRGDYVRGLAVLASERRVAFGRSLLDEDYARTVILDGEDLSFVAESEALKLNGGIYPVAGQGFMVSYDGAVTLLSFDDARRLNSFVPGTGEGVSNDFNVMTALGGGRTAGLASTSNSGVHVLVGNNAEVENVGMYFGRTSRLSSVVARDAVQGDIYTALVGGFELESDPQEGFLTRMVVEEGRFAPDDVVIGEGPVMDLGFDEQGYLWARLPSEGTLLRMDVSGL